MRLRKSEHKISMKNEKTLSEVNGALIIVYVNEWKRNYF